MSSDLTLISHHLCPYVQRVAIALHEKSIDFDRVYIDPGNKPQWFKRVSPLGKVPVLEIREQTTSINLFESSAILEYLEEIHRVKLHPSPPLLRASHRSIMQIGSTILDNIRRFHSTDNASSFNREVASLENLFACLYSKFGCGPFYAGAEFTLVEVVVAPVLGYFDVLDTIAEFGILQGKPKLNAWRNELARRESVKLAVTSDYTVRLKQFLFARNSYLSTLMADTRKKAL